MIPARLQPLTHDLKIYGGIFVKPMFFPHADVMVPQHQHTYDHLSLVAYGSVDAWRGEDYLGRFVAPAAIEIPAGTTHTFHALIAGTLIYCIHSVREGEEAAPILDPERT